MCVIGKLVSWKFSRGNLFFKFILFKSSKRGLDCCNLPLPNMVANQAQRNKCAKECPNPNDESCETGCFSKEFGVLKDKKFQNEAFIEFFIDLKSKTKPTEAWKNIIKKSVSVCVTKRNKTFVAFLMKF